MVVLSLEKLLLVFIDFITGQNIQIVSGSVEVSLVFSKVLVVDRESPVMTYICQTVCGTLRAEAAV